MAIAKIVKVTIVCELGYSNNFRFSGMCEDGSEVRVTGAGDQKVDLLKELLEKLKIVYPVEDHLPAEVYGSEIVGVAI